MPDVSQVGQWVEQTVEAVLGRLGHKASPFEATYRLQLHADFTFRDAAAVVPYLHSLGISHVYASPYTRARPGSVHGYDVCDHNQLNPALGGEDGFRDFVESLDRQGMGHILDVVPNHMAAYHENAWWRDVLENGPNSPYSGYFDIDWKPVKTELENKVLIPILGAQYGDVLEGGQLRIEHADGGFQIRYFDRILPFGPKTTIPLLTHRVEQLQSQLGAESESFIEYQSILTALEHLPPATATTPKAVLERQREKEVIKRRLRDLEAREPSVAEFLHANVETFNGRAGEPESFDRLDKLLQMQSYRLCHWRAASDEINYRRFFDINDLAAISVEKPEVFHAMHGLIGRLVGDGTAAGLRIDHVDGLFGPEEYLWRLQWVYLAQVAQREFGRVAESPVESLELSVAVAQETEASAAVGDAATSTAVAVEPKTHVYRLGPVVLRQLCRRLGLREPTEADLAAVFGAGILESLRRDAGLDLNDLAGPTREVGAVDGEPPADAPLYVVVEKILGPDEPLPETWPVAGTTGYDYGRLLNGLFIDADGYSAIEKAYLRFTGEQRRFEEVVRDCKRLILRFSMSSELQMLAHRMNRLSEQHRKSRDFTLNNVRYALREVLASFPVYRTYPGPGGVSERDRKVVTRAVAMAKRRNPAMDPATYDFVRDVLLLRHPPGLSAEAVRAREEFAGKFQQVTSPIMAKGVEDTAFYVYAPLLSANEVGGDPLAAVTRMKDFHEQNRQRRQRQRRGLLATTTHDTKRTEDVRARINVLTEMPKRWAGAVNRWSRLTRRWRQDVDGATAPSAEDEYLFYQTLVGMWPTGKIDRAARESIVERMQTYMEKATREAKQRTSWINPDAQYDQAMRQFVAECLTPARDNKFLSSFEEFHKSIVDAGALTAVSQTVLKLTSPGVPDIYQGQELWDFSLVDPDNRRPVDYRRRAALLEQVRAAWKMQPEARRHFAADLAQRPTDERLKLFVTWRLLSLRSEHPALSVAGDYIPLECRGRGAAHVAAFARRAPGADDSAPPALVVVVPRWWVKLCETAGIEHVVDATTHADKAWADTEVVLPSAGNYVDVFTAERWDLTTPSVRLSEALRSFPAAVWLHESEAHS